MYKAKSNIKRKAITTNDTCQEILGAELQNISTTAVNLPAMKDIKKIIRRHRFDNNIPPIPLRRQDIPVIAQPYQLTNGGAQFLLFDCGTGDEKRILIFSTQEAIQLLARNEHWFMDGTFKLCPQIFYQIYTLHALINNQIFPCLFTLLTNKTENIYTRLLTEVCNTVQNVGNGPTDILLDFERAAIKSCSGSNVSSAGKH